MRPPRTRRAVLRALGVAGTLGVAGSTTASNGGSGGTEGPSPPDSTTSPIAPTTTPDTTERTEALTGGPDERVTATPPGSPALHPIRSWPSYRFDAGNTGAVPGADGLRDAEPAWRLDAGGPASLVGGTLFNLHRRGQQYTSLTRRDAATAEVRSATRLVRYGTNAPPTVADGRVVVTSFVEVFCLAADRDAVRWRGPEMDGIHRPPTVHDGTVYVNSGGFKSVPAQLRAFDAASGEQRWRYDTGSASKGTPAVGSGAVFVDSDEGLHAVESATGARRFVVEAAANAWGTPAVADGTAYVTNEREDGDELLAVDARDGTVRWRFPTDATGDAPPVVADSHVYVGTADGVVALDAVDGSRVADLGGVDPPVARLGDVLYTTGRGRLTALDVGGAGRLWSYATDAVRIEDTGGREIYGSPRSTARCSSARATRSTGSDPRGRDAPV